MTDAGSVSFTYDDDGKTASGQIQVRAEGIDLDDALNLLVSALEADEAGYVVTRALVTETVTRDKRGPSVRKGKVAGQVVPVPAEGKVGRREGLRAPAVTMLDTQVATLSAVDRG